MDDPVRVGRRERPEDAQPEAGGARRGERAVGIDELDKRLAVEQLHHNEGLTPMVHYVEDHHRPRVIEARRRTRLCQDPGTRRIPFGGRHTVGEGHLFDGDITAEEQVLASPYHGHPPTAQEGDKQVSVGYAPLVSVVGHGVSR